MSLVGGGVSVVVVFLYGMIYECYFKFELLIGVCNGYFCVKFYIYGSEYE